MKRIWIVCIVCLFLCCSCSSADNIRVMNLTEILSMAKSDSNVVYIFNFWATWCKPCVEELPEFEKITKQYSKNRAKVILVSLDFPKQVNKALKTFVRKKNIKSSVVWLNEKNPNTIIDRVSEQWSGSLPATLIVKGTRTLYFHEGQMSFEDIVEHLN